MDVSMLMKCVEDRLTLSEMASILHVSPQGIWLYMKRHGIPYSRSSPRVLKEKKYPIEFWKNVQFDYDNGMSSSMIDEKYKICSSITNWAVKRGWFIRRGLSDANKLAHKFGRRPKHHTTQTKEKISTYRKKAIADGILPGWKSRKGKMPSYPEKFFIEVLTNNSIKFQREFPVGKYFIDFAITDKMIALEIDGRQHDEDVRRKRDEQKDKFLMELGWRVYRIKWKSINSDVGKLYIKSEIDKFINYASVA